MSDIATQLGKKQREISISEFFEKNRHLLGFDNPKRALITSVKEAVDNSLDACEEANILPEIYVEIKNINNDEYQIIVEDNGPGIIKSEIPKIFGKLLYGSKFHTLKMSRGQQGLGISAAVMYSQLTTGKPTIIKSKIKNKNEGYYYELRINTQKNQPEIVKFEEIQWEKEQGIRIEMNLIGKYQKGRQSVDEYIELTSIANPHLKIIYKLMDEEPRIFERLTNELPKQTKEIKPHPYGVEFGKFINMLKMSKANSLKKFLKSEFSRISDKVATEIIIKSGIKENKNYKNFSLEEIEKVYKAMQEVKILAPSAECIAPIGEEILIKGLKNVIEPEFITSITRPPAVYRGNPFQIEAAIAYGKEKENIENNGVELNDDNEDDKTLVKVLRVANRVPLIYQQSSCAITKTILSINWKSYGLQQNPGALPTAPAVFLVHIASVWVPYTSEAKEAIAHYPEIIKEIKLALQECGRRLAMFLKRKKREEEYNKKRMYIEKYIPVVVEALKEILEFPDKKVSELTNNLTKVLERSKINE
ncbi:MAG TPA: DNA topoisomerase VI subunit B [bacterium]|nr:DNA topoisomerase VI subunit B [bacterium]HOL47053.1 DNA topoisomerase VI subunit B [bacterium]HPQ17942.1 DNA topoisomerase VI subunit B [bacterium]